MAYSIKTEAEIPKMRVAGRLTADVLDMIEPYVQPRDHNRRTRSDLSRLYC